MKIDYLVPMVFPFDPEWQRTWRRACGAMLIDDAQLCARYRTWCTEQLLIECVQRFMPWLNQIVIILAGPSQVQPWMAEMGVRVVFHADFIPQEYLPLCAALAMKAGMDEFHALQAITIRPAQHIGAADRVGSVEVGKDADLVLMDGLWHDTAANAVMVLVDGKVAAKAE